MKVGRGDLCDPLETEVRREMIPRQVVYYRTGDDTGALNLEERIKG